MTGIIIFEMDWKRNVITNHEKINVGWAKYFEEILNVVEGDEEEGENERASRGETGRLFQGNYMGSFWKVKASRVYEISIELKVAIGEVVEKRTLENFSKLFRTGKIQRKEERTIVVLIFEGENRCKKFEYYKIITVYYV